MGLDYSKELNTVYIDTVDASHVFMLEQKKNESDTVEYRVGDKWYPLTYIPSTRAALTDSLFLRYMRSSITVSKANLCRDFIVVKFDYEARYMLNKVEQQNMKASDLRQKYYENGLEYTYVKKDKNGVIVDKTTIKYVPLMRSPGKAKNGRCVFVREELFNKAIKYLSMGLYQKMKDHFAENPDATYNIVGLSAYQTLTTATAVGYLHVPLEQILILEDVEVLSEPMKAAVVSVKKMDQKTVCAVDTSNEEIKNIIWDGMGIIDESIVPDFTNGFLYLRSHFFKACMFRGNMEQYFRDYCEENHLDYDTYTVKDMFGIDHKLSEIKVVTTDKAIKFLKFTDWIGGTKEKAYKMWKKWMEKYDCMFGIVKTAHKSKLGDIQKMSYQMMNSLPTENTDELARIAEVSADYYNSLKQEENYLEYLRRNQNGLNINELLLDLVGINHKIVQTKLFKDKWKKDLNELKSSMLEGELYQPGDNLTITDNPLALLQYAVGQNPLQEGCFQIRKDGVECYTSRFAEGASLAAFRSPHNSPNNIIHLYNVYPSSLIKYFPNLGDNVIILNAIGTDTQARLSGHDVDSDFLFVTDQSDIARLAQTAYLEYPTIINAVPEVGNGTGYHFTMADFATMDNKIASAQASIGISTDKAQLALSYFFDDGAESEELKNVIVILSVIGQISIDLAKKEFGVDVVKEINRLKWLPCMKREGKIKYPLFYARTKKRRNNKKFKPEEVGKMNCPVDLVAEQLETMLNKYKSGRTSVYNMGCLLNTELLDKKKANRHRRNKFLELVKEYDKEVRSLEASTEDKKSDEFFRQRQELLDRFMLKATKALDQDTVLYLVLKAVEDTTHGSTMLNFLYRQHKQMLLNCFMKN